MKNETARREIESLDYYLQNHTDDYGEESHTAMMMAKDALNKADVLEQIRQEIKHLLNRPSLTHVVGYDKGFVDGIDKVLQIIDKYKGDKE